MNTAESRLKRRSLRKSAGGFAPITIAEYVKLHAASNPGTDVVELSQRLQAVLKAKLGGATCQCGEPIWAIGSAEVGFMCFTCITDEAVPDNDYEVVSRR
jgi:hypothetical protein